jgi:PIN domain nuclease of toxin-antitoxin system
VESPSYVVDTHVLAWHATGARKLGRAARDVLDRAESGAVVLYVPAPVLAELAGMSRNGKLRIASSFRRWWSDLQTTGFVGIPLELDDVLRASELDWNHADMLDRVIVATALRLDVPLVTADRAIAKWGGVEVVW